MRVGGSEYLFVIPHTYTQTHKVVQKYYRRFNESFMWSATKKKHYDEERKRELNDLFNTILFL